MKSTPEKRAALAKLCIEVEALTRELNDAPILHHRMVEPLNQLSFAARQFVAAHLGMPAVEVRKEA